MKTIKRWLLSVGYWLFCLAHRGEDVCRGCWGVVDYTTCWCGSPVDGHGYWDGHSAVPMGCDCLRYKPSNWYQRVLRWSRGES